MAPNNTNPRLAGSRLWLVPPHPERAGTIMRLGSILKDPEDLETSLNLHRIPPIPELSKRNLSDSLRKTITATVTSSNGPDGSVAGAEQPLPMLAGLGSVGATAKFKKGNNMTADVVADNVRATVFIPDKPYMDLALSDPEVLQYARSGLFGSPLYIIVGVATTGRLTIRGKAGREIEANIALKAEVTGIGGGEAGIGHERRTELEVSDEFHGENDFAYRVREFYYSKISRRLSEKGNYVNSAIFNGEEKLGETEEDEEVAEFLFFDEEEVDLPGKKMGTMDVQGDF